MMKEMQFNKGFTVMELLVVIVIMGALAGILLSSYGEVRKHARDAKRVEDFNALQTALELYYKRYGNYPCGDANTGTDPVGGEYSEYYLDTSTSSPFLDGESEVGDPPNNYTANCGQAGSDDPRARGLHTAGLYPKDLAVDPLNEWETSIYEYLVPESSSRDTYLLFVALEVKKDVARNDEGVCSRYYEVGPGAGILDFSETLRSYQPNCDDWDE